MALADQPDQYQMISDIFTLCKVPKSSDDVWDLINALSDDIGSMVMVNYPYPTSFIAPLPAWPIDYACKQAASALTEHSSDTYPELYGIEAVGSVFYNYEGQMTCLDTGDS